MTRTALPIRRRDFKLKKFIAWLTDQGAEVISTTNPYEVVRYRAYVLGGARPQTHIVYAKDSGLLNFVGATREHYEAFLAGGTVSGMFVSQFDPPPADTRAQRRFNSPDKPGQRAKLLDRDGNECWFCGLEMASDDMTIEHLAPKSAGGRNMLVNYALAHSVCNNRAGDMPLIQKIEMRTKMRAGKVES
jgi:hypothetical protein